MTTTDPRKLQRAVARAEATYASACEARNNWLIDRINDGWTHQQISDALGISRGRVAAILKSSAQIKRGTR